MLDPIGVPSADPAGSGGFHRSALQPLGIGIVMEVTAEETDGDAHIRFGTAGKPYFWIGEDYGNHGRIHIAFPAGTRADVDAFHAAVPAAGGRDNGARGVRPRHHEHYFGGFVLDSDGHDIEAVCHRPEA